MLEDLVEDRNERHEDSFLYLRSRRNKVRLYLNGTYLIAALGAEPERGDNESAAAHTASCMND